MCEALKNLYQQLAFKGIEPALREAHREHLLVRSRLAIITATALIPLVILPYFFVAHPELFLTALLHTAVHMAACILLLFGLRFRMVKKYYHLPTFLLIGVIFNLSEIMLLLHLGEGKNVFLFGYILMDLGTAIYLPGSFFWTATTLGALPLSYLLLEWQSGANLLSAPVIANWTYLIVGFFLGVIGNQILLALFFRDKRNQLKLEMANQKLLKVTAHVAHDLNSPLASIGVVATHCQTAANLPAEILNLLNLSHKRLQGIVGDLLEKQRPREGAAAAAPCLFSLHRILDELVGELSAGTGSRIAFQKAYGEAISCLGNRDRIQRAFGNLLKNAIEAIDQKWEQSPKDGTVPISDRQETITIRTVIDSGRAVVEISDTGCGMTPAALASALQGGHTMGKRDGHGIGTTVVREVLEEHHGSIEARSEIGTGTTFRIRLPLPESREIRSAETEEGAGVFELTLAPREPVVLIDDDPSVQLQWEILLRPQGHDILAYDSWEDFDRKRAERPVLRTAIVDYHFDNSECDGLAVIARLRQEGYTNLYLCTAEYWKPLVQKQAKTLGIPLCPKPIPQVVVKIT